MNYVMPTLLVTGGAGFVGSHTCLVLLLAGYDIIVFDSCTNSSSISIDRIRSIAKQNESSGEIILVNGDLRIYKDIETAFIDAKELGKPIDAVLHFAALKSVGESVLNPLKYWDVNVAGSINLFKVMEKHRCFSLVFSSSATIYGAKGTPPYDENTEIQAVNPYGQTKVTVENLLENLYHSDTINWKIANLRYFNPIGAHESGLIGEDPVGKPNNLFPYIMQVASKKRDILSIYGKDWPTIDGTGVRDYIHVMDVAEAHYEALKFLIDNEPQIFNLNIGTGIGTSVLQLIKVFEKVNNCKIPNKVEKRRDGDVSECYADVSNVKKKLGWQAKRGLEEMCKDGWNWQVKNPSGYRDN